MGGANSSILIVFLFLIGACLFGASVLKSDEGLASSVSQKADSFGRRHNAGVKTLSKTERRSSKSATSTSPRYRNSKNRNAQRGSLESKPLKRKSWKLNKSYKKPRRNHNKSKKKFQKPQRKYKTKTRRSRKPIRKSRKPARKSRKRNSKSRERRMRSRERRQKYRKYKNTSTKRRKRDWKPKRKHRKKAKKSKTAKAQKKQGKYDRVPYTCFCNMGSPGQGVCYDFAYGSKRYCKRRECAPSYYCVSKNSGTTCVRRKIRKKIVPIGDHTCQYARASGYIYVPYQAYV